MEINKIIYDFIYKPEEKSDNEIQDEFIEDGEGKVVSYPRKKRKLKQKDLFIGIDKEKKKNTKKPNKKKY